MRHRRGAAAIRTFAIAIVLAFVATAGVSTAGIQPAFAATYPSWQDVINARQSEAQTKAAIAQIQGLIAAMRVEVERTGAVAEEKGNLYAEADQLFQEAAIKAENLKAQADAAAASAEESRVKAGQFAAQIARTGSSDLSTQLFLDGENATDLLSMLGTAGKLTQQAEDIYTKATKDKNTAQALTDQATVAQNLREQLKIAAEAAFAEAQAAAQAAANALTAQEEHQAELTAQLAVLEQRRAVTEADYLAGVRATIAAAADLGAGEISASGWARPAAGRITSGFGYRVHPKYGTWRLHTGTDIGAGCNNNIYAAHSGTVVYAGWYGTYGNWVLIDNGDGISTGYAHIVNGGIKVQVGQEVGVGQPIAKVGTTGASTGCHLHYEVRVNGVATDSVPFMRNQGITIG